MDYVYPKHEPISLNNARIPAFLRFMKTKKELTSVKKSEVLLPIGNCYWNVNAMVEDHGGSAVYGWDVMIWSKSHISAMHHAVWRRPDGSLVDVTDTYPTVKNRITSTFLEDDRIDIDLNRQPNIPAKHFIIRDDDATQEYVEACQQLHAIEHQCSAIAYEAGYRCQAQFAIARGITPDEGYPMSLTPASAAQYSMLMGKQPAALQRLGAGIEWLRRVT